MRQKSEETTIFRKVNQKVGKAIQQYGLICEGDRIMVGLSGGKDSMVLLETLSGRLKYHSLKYELAAIHISLNTNTYTVDLPYLTAFTQKLQVPFIHKVIDVDFENSNENNSCFVCSWNRRKALFEIAQELGYNKLALGHHMDDAVETLLMNMIFQSNIGSMPPILSMFGGKMSIIRPLLLLTEREIRNFAMLKAYRKEIKTCIFEKDSKRGEIKKLVEILSAMEPNVRSNIFASMTNIKEEYLPLAKY